MKFIARYFPEIGDRRGVYYLLVLRGFLKNGDSIYQSCMGHIMKNRELRKETDYNIEISRSDRDTGPKNYSPFRVR